MLLKVYICPLYTVYKHIIVGTTSFKLISVLCILSICPCTITRILHMYKFYLIFTFTDNIRYDYEI